MSQTVSLVEQHTVSDPVTMRARLFDEPSDMAALMRSTDWSKTPLGPASSWSPTLRTTVGLMLKNRFPMLLWWGPKFVQLYNDAYRPIAGDKHPRSMGQPGHECWAEIWHIIGPMAEVPYFGGPATTSDDLAVLINRKGFLEETHFKMAYSPVPDESAHPTGIGGVLATVAETTEQVYAARQLRTLRELSARAADATESEHACELAAATLAENPSDVPFALFYLLDREQNRLRLVQATGFGNGEGRANPASIDLDDEAGAGWTLGEVVRKRRLEIFTEIDARFAELPSGRWSQRPHTAIALPLASPHHADPYGVLIIGVSPHRALDEGYRTFFDLAAGQISTAIRNAVAYRAECTRAEKLAELDRAKTTFFSNVSHEFRTPLTLLLGPIEQALHSSPRALAGEDLDIAYRSALRLLKLVNGLLDFSRIEAGRADASFEPTDLATFSTELASEFRSAIESANLELVVACQPLPTCVYVDRGMWETIVLNLISNAFKCTFEGKIEVALRAVEGQAELTVRDTGIGIAPEELPRVFVRFHRIEGARARTHEGSGIGLALVQELVKIHGGTIHVASELGSGTTLTVRIPFGSGHLPSEHVLAKSRQERGIARGITFVEEALRWLPDQAPLADSEGMTTTEGRRILLADDNADMREYVARLLRERWAVDTVADGEAALSALKEQRYDLVVTDAMMPKLDGFGLVRELRADPATRGIPVIMLSARAGEESRIDGINAGADDYVIKPFSARELAARVATRLELRGLTERLSVERAMIAEIFAQTPVPIAVVRGQDLVFDVVNPAFSAMFGGREFKGKTLYSAMPELHGQGCTELLLNVMRSGVPYVERERPIKLTQPDGSIKTSYFRITLAPLRGERGATDRVIAMYNDVTEQVEARVHVEALAAAADGANRTKDEFLAMLGHELRNPLSPILTALRLQQLRGVRSKEQSIIERQVGHLTRLVDDLLDVSRITRGKLELRKERVEIADVVYRGIEMASPLLEQRQHRLHMEVPRTGLVVDVDRDRLAQVVSNLFTNAAKYSDPGSEIAIRAWRVENQIKISVRDNGMGIPPDMLGGIFDMFVQQPQASDRARGGLGLGLTIVQSLIHQHGGKVSVESEGIGKGSEFVIELPAADPPRAAAPNAASESVAKGQMMSEQTKKILVVDDNDDAADTLAAVLDALGYTVEVAHDGPSALHKAEAFAPDVALVDVGLPVMDGYELARRLRKVRGLQAKLRLVAVTGYGQESDRQRSREAGFEEHLVKPVDIDALARVVQGPG